MVVRDCYFAFYYIFYFAFYYIFYFARRIWGYESGKAACSSSARPVHCHQNKNEKIPPPKNEDVGIRVGKPYKSLTRALLEPF